jgi:hypothetical protein
MVSLLVWVRMEEKVMAKATERKAVHQSETGVSWPAAAVKVHLGALPVEWQEAIKKEVVEGRGIFISSEVVHHDGAAQANVVGVPDAAAVVRVAEKAADSGIQKTSLSL